MTPYHSSLTFSAIYILLSLFREWKISVLQSMLSFFFLFLLKVTFDSLLSYFVPVLPLANCICYMPTFFSTWTITPIYNVLAFFVFALSNFWYFTINLCPCSATQSDILDNSLLLVSHSSYTTVSPVSIDTHFACVYIPK